MSKHLCFCWRIQGSLQFQSIYLVSVVLTDNGIQIQEHSYLISPDWVIQYYMWFFSTHVYLGSMAKAVEVLYRYGSHHAKGSPKAFVVAAPFLLFRMSRLHTGSWRQSQAFDLFSILIFVLFLFCIFVLFLFYKRKSAID